MQLLLLQLPRYPVPGSSVSLKTTHRKTALHVAVSHIDSDLRPLNMSYIDRCFVITQEGNLTRMVHCSIVDTAKLKKSVPWGMRDTLSLNPAAWTKRHHNSIQAYYWPVHIYCRRPDYSDGRWRLSSAVITLHGGAYMQRNSPWGSTRRRASSVTSRCIVNICSIALATLA